MFKDQDEENKKIILELACPTCLLYPCGCPGGGGDDSEDDEDSRDRCGMTFCDTHAAYYIG